MKKMLLSLAVTLLAATSITAQISSVMNVPADVQLQNPYPTSLVPRGFRAPANRVELADNQLIMGGYTTDQIATPGNGLGVGSYTTGRVGAYLELPCSAIADFDGSQVVKMRVGLAAAATIYQITILPVKNGSIQTAILDQAVRSTSQGWNEFTLDTPLTLDLADYDALLMGFTYNQASNVYPLSCVNAGSESYNTLIYANLGNGIGYYNIGNSYGNLSVQAIVEGDFPQYKAIPQSIGDVIIPLGGSVTKSLDIYNKGKANLESIDYVITIDGEAQPEQHVELATPVIYGEKGEAEIIFDAAATECFQDYTLTVTKVNGEENAATNPVISGRAITTTKIFQRRVTVEEFTGLTCGYCPRGIVGMEMMRQRYGDQLVQIAIHQYSSLSQDAMTIAASNYARLTFTGAPGCMLDRMGEVDPYYGSTNGDDFGISQLIDVLLAQPAFVNVDVNGEWNEDSTKVVATALVDPLIDGSEYDLEFVLIGDSLTGTGSGWTQTNYYASYTAAQVGEDMADFCRGGKYGKSSVTGLYFNDVALASSYKSNKNQIDRQVYSAAEPTEVNYTLTLPTTTAMKKAMRRDNMYIAALIIDPATGYIMNAAKTKLPVYVPEPQPEVLDFTIDHERQTGMGYTADEVAVDFTEAISFLGVESLTTDMLFFENPDGSLIDYNAYATANYDGWCNEEGAAENWGSNTKICVKFFQAISAPDGKFQI
ncbi:MAG: hypothetical protein J5552_07205, partial [Prevotella sp.]|nr:hypothetical protein [Prevotella sp.]